VAKSGKIKIETIRGTNIPRRKSASNSNTNVDPTVCSFIMVTKKIALNQSASFRD
jgi:hypothetical protein